MITNIINGVPHCGKYLCGYFKVRMGNSKLIRLRSFSTDSNGLKDLVEVLPHSENKTKVTFSNGEELEIATGKFAKMADGCATVTYHGTTVMATVVSKPTPKKASFLPLTVSYKQKAAALGRIPLNYRRRDVGLSEGEILTSRIIDRSIRPLFIEGYQCETQIICNPFALDGNNFPDVLCINAASAALAVSDIPWNGPVGAVRVGLIDGKVLINPTKRQLTNSTLNLVVSAINQKLIVMLEGSSSGVSLGDFLKAVKDGIKECQIIVNGIEKLSKDIGKPKRDVEPINTNPELINAIKILSENKLKDIFSDDTHHKLSRDQAVFNLQQEVIQALREEEFSAQDIEAAPEVYHKTVKDVFRNRILTTGIRCDGRTKTELRPIHCEVNLYPPLHGSALFQRGQTQVLCTVALDSPNAVLKMDNVTMATSGVVDKNFFVHYEFPPFATKEIGPLGPTGRREIGHGALAEKALKAIVPSTYPFTIRLTSEVLESNGSSSMATVCGGSLALMDAGVPVECACAGVAMGLITKYSETEPSKIEDFAVLTDIMGIEDHFGDMDFKIAITKTALTAIQVDVKIPGFSMHILSQILSQAKSATSEILKKMNKTLDRTVFKKKENMPSVDKVIVPPHIRQKFVGLGGVNIKKLEMEVGVEVIEETPGSFTIFASNNEAMEEAKIMIAEILKDTREPVLEFGGVYTATITELREHGCMVILYPGMQPVLLPNSQLDQRKVSHPSALGLEVSQTIQVKYFGRDPVSGLMRLSRKVLQGPVSQVAHNFVKRDSSEDVPSEDVEEKQV